MNNLLEPDKENDIIDEILEGGQNKEQRENNMVYKKMTITIPQEIIDKLEKISQKEMRTKSNMICSLIQRYEL